MTTKKKPLAKVEFCCGKRRCPVIQEREDGSFDVGGKKEGVTVFSKGNLQDLIAAAKSGKLDHLIT